jgi:hypothetical protein
VAPKMTVTAAVNCKHSSQQNPPSGHGCAQTSKTSGHNAAAALRCEPTTLCYHNSSLQTLTARQPDQSVFSLQPVLSTCPHSVAPMIAIFSQWQHYLSASSSAKAGQRSRVFLRSTMPPSLTWPFTTATSTSGISCSGFQATPGVASAAQQRRCWPAC